METGIYFRIHRDTWETLDLTEMTDSEIVEMLMRFERDSLVRTIVRLTRMVGEQ